MSSASAQSNPRPTGWGTLRFELKVKIVACAVEAGLEQIDHQTSMRYTMEAVFARACYLRRDPLGSILLVNIEFIKAAERPLFLAVQDIRPKAVEAVREINEHQAALQKMPGRSSNEQMRSALEKFKVLEAKKKTLVKQNNDCTRIFLSIQPILVRLLTPM